ncbi:MAG: superoxide dismutase family protein [Bdellovibrionota bacterium]
MKTSLAFRFSAFSSLIAISCAVFASTSSIEIKLIPSTTLPKVAGTVTFSSLKDNRIEIKGKITGLTPGEHGMHIHAVGDCSDPAAGFKKSGGHFNPEHKNHGSLTEGHAGDLGNIIADAGGKATFKIITEKFNLVVNDKHSILGQALVVHAGKDDEKTDPAGNSGERILCGVIK